MSEISKLYESAGVKICKRKQGFTLKDCTDRDCKECGYYGMPPFTAEKQIEVIKWLASYGKYEPTRKLLLQCLDGEWYIAVYEGTDVKSNGAKVDFKECLARVINKIWQSLTEEEKQQIKEILE